MSDETTTPDYTPGTGGPGDAPVYPLQSLSHGRDGTLFASQYGGLTLRQWFAGQALVGLLATQSGESAWLVEPGDLAVRCSLIADALIADLKGGAT